jgi:hypothetical protein
MEGIAKEKQPQPSSVPKPIAGVLPHSSIPHKWVYLAGTLALVLGINGGFYDLTYHITNKVDTFFQPAHLLIYSNIFGSVVFGAILFVKARFKSLLLFGGLILGSGVVDLLWHNRFGFDSFLSPPHLVIISSAILGVWAMFRKFNQMNLRMGVYLSLAGLLLELTFLLLSFSMTFAKTSSDSGYYVMPSQEVAAVSGFLLLPAVMVLVSKLAHQSNVKFFPIALIFSGCMMATTVLPNRAITFTVPLLLAGALLPAFAYDKSPKYGVLVIGAAWFLTFSPYSYQITAYVVSGRIYGVTQITSDFIFSLVPYYPLASIAGLVSAIFTSRALTQQFIEKKILLLYPKA